MADRIELRGLRVMGTHGVLPEEHARPQPFEIDLDASIDLRVASTSDRLQDTIDYGWLAEQVARIVSGERYELLERLAGRIAEMALADPRVTSVDVVVRKLRPPVAVDLATAGVRVTRP